MSEPTYYVDAPAPGDWSQVYTGLDWVAHWMADRGYTQAEITYVVGEHAASVLPGGLAAEPVDVPFEPPATAVVEVPAAVKVVETAKVVDAEAAEQPVWTVRLAQGAESQADSGEGEDTDWAEPASA